MYYGTMEKFGQEKRDILVKRVGKARDAQQETQVVQHHGARRVRTADAEAET